MTLFRERDSDLLKQHKRAQSISHEARFNDHTASLSPSLLTLGFKLPVSLNASCGSYETVREMLLGGMPHPPREKVTSAHLKAFIHCETGLRRAELRGANLPARSESPRPVPGIGGFRSAALPIATARLRVFADREQIAPVPADRSRSARLLHGLQRDGRPDSSKSLSRSNCSLETPRISHHVTLYFEVTRGCQRVLFFSHRAERKQDE